MCSYPRNSPEAAARIVALVLIADGQMCGAETAVLQAMGAERALGLRRPGPADGGGVGNLVDGEEPIARRPARRGTV